jgi:hypothetical protein
MSREYIVTISSPRCDDVVLSLDFPSDWSARSYAIKLEENWLRRCDVAICRCNGEVVYMSDSLRRWKERA